MTDNRDHIIEILIEAIKQHATMTEAEWARLAYQLGQPRTPNPCQRKPAPR